MIQIIELLSRINSLLMRDLMPSIKAENLTPTEMLIIWKVYRKEHCKTTDIAKDADVPPSTFTGIVDRLVMRKYLTRIYDLEDRRSVLISGTKELEDLMGHLVLRFDDALEKIFTNMPEDVFQNINENLKILYQYLDQENKADSGCEKGESDQNQLRGRCCPIEKTNT
jgi:DNA-binding MarR family transcriptional regulator